MKQRILRTLFVILTVAMALSAMAVCAFADEPVCQHTGGTATCTAQAVCTECSQPYGSLAEHTTAYENISAGSHRVYCGVCDFTITATESCYGGTASCEYQAKCDACDTAYGSVPAGHTYDTEWTGGELYHFHACLNCGSPKLSDRAEHSFGSWTTTLSPTSESEGKSERTCSVCSYVQSKAVPKLPPERLSGWAIAAIVVGIVLVVAVGVFAIIWFAVKKKSFADIANLFKKKTAEEAPKEETAEAAASAEKAPAEEAPVEEAPVEEASAEESAADEGAEA